MTMFWILYATTFVALNIGIWAIKAIAKTECAGCPHENNFFREVFSYEKPTVCAVLWYLAVTIIWPLWILLGTVSVVIRAIKK